MFAAASSSVIDLGAGRLRRTARDCKPALARGEMRDQLLSLILLVPAAGTVACMLLPKQRPERIRTVALATSLLGLLAVVPLWLSFDRSRFRFLVSDRLLAPNTGDAYDRLAPLLESETKKLTDGEVTLARVDAERRDRLAIDVTTAEAIQVPAAA